MATKPKMKRYVLSSCIADDERTGFSSISDGIHTSSGYRLIQGCMTSSVFGGFKEREVLSDTASTILCERACVFISEVHFAPTKVKLRFPLLRRNVQ